MLYSLYRTTKSVWKMRYVNNDRKYIHVSNPCHFLGCTFLHVVNSIRTEFQISILFGSAFTSNGGRRSLTDHWELLQLKKLLYKYVVYTAVLKFRYIIQIYLLLFLKNKGFPETFILTDLPKMEWICFLLLLSRTLDWVSYLLANNFQLTQFPLCCTLYDLTRKGLWSQ
jgi:hypothetical protein